MICRDVTGVSLPEGNINVSVRVAYYRAEVWDQNLVDRSSYAKHTV
jgi:hypothetical protein